MFCEYQIFRVWSFASEFEFREDHENWYFFE